MTEDDELYWYKQGFGWGFASGAVSGILVGVVATYLMSHYIIIF